MVTFIATIPSIWKHQIFILNPISLKFSAYLVATLYILGSNTAFTASLHDIILQIVLWICIYIYICNLVLSYITQLRK